jgi:hypothetical protein
MAKGQRSYSFNSEWEEQYCFIEYRGKPACLLCNGGVSVPKKSNVERHFHPKQRLDLARSTRTFPCVCTTLQAQQN